MGNKDGNTGTGPAHERIGEILRSALYTAEEEAALEDETRRLMLHLSIEPVPSVSPRPPARPPARASLLRRLFDRRREVRRE